MSWSALVGVVRVTVGARGHGGFDLLVGQLVTGADGDVTEAELLGPGVDGDNGILGHLLKLALGGLDAASLGLGHHPEGLVVVDAYDAINCGSLEAEQLVEELLSSLAEGCAKVHVDVAVVQHAITEMDVFLLVEGDGLNPVFRCQ